VQPRPYQQHAIEAVRSGFDNFSKLLGVAPTGSGKTVLFSHIAKNRLPERTLILAHREELIDQAIDKLFKATGIRAEKEKAEFAASLSASVVVASIQTMQRRLEKWPQDHFGLVVCDEAHHSISSSWRSVLSHFDSNADVLGVTATPDRGDKRNLGSYYENIAFEISLFDLIHDGFLSRITIKSVPIEIDLKGVSQVAGDYDQSELGQRLEPYLHRIALAIREHASFRKVLVFLPLIHTSQLFVEECRKVGIAAGHVDGYAENRREILTSFARGEFDLLSNAMLLTEGYDDPSIDCVIVLRPTRSRSLYSQMVGRGTRISPVKENLLLLDFLWMHQKHNLIRPAHLIAKSDDEAEVITKIAEEKSAGGGQQEFELEGLATEAAEQRHEALRKQLEANRKKKTKHIDAMEWCMQMGQPDLADYEPVMQWESSPMTEKQSKLLKRAGIDVATISGRGHASKLIDVYFKNQKVTLASEGQRKIMQRMGHPDWEKATADQARKFFASIRNKAA
jgi:superfamily II DNA or RNA helicase